MFEIIMQLHGGGGKGGGASIKQSAPGSTAAATIANATDEQRQKYQELLSQAKGKKSTIYAGREIEKALKLGE